MKFIKHSQCYKIASTDEIEYPSIPYQYHQPTATKVLSSLPSQRLINWAFIIAVASWSLELRVRRKESIKKRKFIWQNNLKANTVPATKLYRDSFHVTWCKWSVVFKASVFHLICSLYKICSHISFTKLSIQTSLEILLSDSICMSLIYAFSFQKRELQVLVLLKQYDVVIKNHTNLVDEYDAWLDLFRLKTYTQYFITRKDEPCRQKTLLFVDSMT